ncbi:alpha-L-fucosidase [Pontiella agarivorans]|uniref:alpha-L-fucosidase n=1 Tax=Pontiella agarivorans TaxID=3038953 RepID=A0ABU5N0F0_9BACT|nr:alpha-L-fucosidase [Pontiella agarivorans]MDZ8119917.1 alpha-L-fucosidase [Pontiella agarivorans]
MITNKKWILPALLTLGSARAQLDTALPYADGPCEPTWESLAENYECPEWFRDAKFGIWAHWGVQCVPGTGDWCAKFLYKPTPPRNAWWEERGKQCYDYHIEHYGHPSEIGLKDYIPHFTASKWNPDHLLDLYQKAGARYFVAMANHHDNFDNWDSTYQPWNAVNMGPKQDLIAGWRKAARKRGLKFGVSVHAARQWSWMTPAFGADREGPKKGIPYDGHMTKEDGKGKWWEGCDPCDLYGPPRTARTPPSQKYLDTFYLRTRELIDRYNPDLLYFDDKQAPLQNVGLKIAAHYYNRALERHGKVDVVLNTKLNDETTKPALVDDVERGSKNDIDPNPWQIDTCIGYWHYRTDVTYKTPGKVIHMLLDAVSKNGSLLLNIPMKPDGTLEPQEITFLKGMAAWMDIHGEGIYGTRPWEVYGEGVFIDAAGHNLETKMNAYTQTDFRFTKKDQTLYAFCLATPKTDLLIKSLATGARSKPHTVKTVELLGSDEPLEWEQTGNGLKISKPEFIPTDYSLCFRLTFKDKI